MILTSYIRISIPFFFEPNWNALVQPLPAALRILDSIKTSSDGGAIINEAPTKKPRKAYTPVNYGDFLTRKVTNNFAGGGKYT